MRALIGIFRMRAGLFLNYRMAAIAGVGTQLFFGMVMVMTYHAFYGSNSSGTISELPMTLVQTTTYIWLGQGLLGLLPWNGDREIQGMIRNGDFAYELVRPIDLYYLWSARMLAQRVVPTILKSIPLFFIVGIFGQEAYGISGPVDFAGGIYFAMTLFSGVLLGVTISNLITISVLFTIGDGIERLLPAVVTIFSGLVIPLAFFPDYIQGFLRLLPFSGVADAPYRFYIGLYGMSDLGLVLLHQFIWTLLLGILGRRMMQKASRRIVVQGG